MALEAFVTEGKKEKSDVVKRYVGPVAVVVAILALWSFFVSPWIAEMRADLAFLRAARIQIIQQQIQAAQQGQKLPQGTPEAK